MPSDGFWEEELPAAITVADADGIIVSMNALARETFALQGGGALVGKSVFECHPDRAIGKIRRLYEKKVPNHYTIRKNGRKKIIHQIPWFRQGSFAGFVEISVPVPDEIPGFDR